MHDQEAQSGIPLWSTTEKRITLKSVLPQIKVFVPVAHGLFKQALSENAASSKFQIWKESFHMNSVQVRPGSRACLMALEAFGILILKYAFSHILETLFLSILTVQPQKLIKKIVHQTVLQLLMRYGKWSEARKFYELSGENSSIMWLVAHCFSLMSQSMSSKWKFTFKNW